VRSRSSHPAYRCRASYSGLSCSGST
jgi:hypothetical protein